MITDRNLKPGTLLKATYKGTEYLGEIKTYASEKELEFKGISPTEGLHAGRFAGQTFTSLSKAAMAITDNSVNGWRFWSLAAPPAGKTSDLLDPETGDERDTSIDRLRRQRLKREGKPGVADAVDLPSSGPAVEDVAGIAQDTAAADPGFENGGKFTADAKRKKPRVYKPIRPVANQRGIEAGATRMWCDGCMASFIASGDVEGYKADDATCPSGHEVGKMREAAQGTPQDAAVAAQERADDVQRIEGAVDLDGDA